MKTQHILNLDPYIRRAFRIPEPEIIHRDGYTILRLSWYDFERLTDEFLVFGLPIAPMFFLAILFITFVLTLYHAIYDARAAFVALLIVAGLFLSVYKGLPDTSEYILIGDELYSKVRVKIQRRDVL